MGDLRLTTAGFKRMWLELTHQELEGDIDVAQDVLDEAFRHTEDHGIDGEKRLNFNQFAIWFSSCYFREDVSLDEEAKKVRKLARKHSIHHADVERYKRIFHSFDGDGSGTIDCSEFEKLLCICTKVPKSIGLPAARVKHLWQIADADGDQEITFDEFLTFYTKYLTIDSTGFEEFYRFRSRADNCHRKRAHQCKAG